MYSSSLSGCAILHLNDSRTMRIMLDGNLKLPPLLLEDICAFLNSDAIVTSKCVPYTAIDGEDGKIEFVIQELSSVFKNVKVVCSNDVEGSLAGPNTKVSPGTIAVSKHIVEGQPVLQFDVHSFAPGIDGIATLGSLTAKEIQFVSNLNPSFQNLCNNKDISTCDVELQQKPPVEETMNSRDDYIKLICKAILAQCNASKPVVLPSLRVSTHATTSNVKFIGEFVNDYLGDIFPPLKAKSIVIKFTTYPEHDHTLLYPHISVSTPASFYFHHDTVKAMIKMKDGDVLPMTSLDIWMRLCPTSAEILAALGGDTVTRVACTWGNLEEKNAPAVWGLLAPWAEVIDLTLDTVWTNADKFLSNVADTVTTRPMHPLVVVVFLPTYIHSVTSLQTFLSLLYVKVRSLTSFPIGIALACEPGADAIAILRELDIEFATSHPGVNVIGTVQWNAYGCRGSHASMIPTGRDPKTYLDMRGLIADAGLRVLEPSPESDRFGVLYTEERVRRYLKGEIPLDLVLLRAGVPVVRTACHSLLKAINEALGTLSSMGDADHGRIMTINFRKLTPQCGATTALLTTAYLLAKQISVIDHNIDGSKSSKMNYSRPFVMMFDWGNYVTVNERASIWRTLSEMCEVTKCPFVLMVDDSTAYECDAAPAIEELSRTPTGLEFGNLRGVIVRVSSALCTNTSQVLYSISPYLDDAEVKGFSMCYCEHFPDSAPVVKEAEIRALSTPQPGAVVTGTKNILRDERHMLSLIMAGMCNTSLLPRALVSRAWEGLPADTQPSLLALSLCMLFGREKSTRESIIKEWYRSWDIPPSLSPIIKRETIMDVDLVRVRHGWLAQCIMDKDNMSFSLDPPRIDSFYVVVNLLKKTLDAVRDSYRMMTVRNLLMMSPEVGRNVSIDGLSPIARCLFNYWRYSRGSRDLEGLWNALYNGITESVKLSPNSYSFHYLAFIKRIMLSRLYRYAGYIRRDYRRQLYHRAVMYAQDARTYLEQLRNKPNEGLDDVASLQALAFNNLAYAQSYNGQWREAARVFDEWYSIKTEDPTHNRQCIASALDVLQFWEGKMIKESDTTPEAMTELKKFIYIWRVRAPWVDTDHITEEDMSHHSVVVNELENLGPAITFNMLWPWHAVYFVPFK